MRLEDIGFYTLTDERARHASSTSPLARCELLVTDACNFRCPYCRGVAPQLRGNMDLTRAHTILDYWTGEGLRAVRFTGGEPTLYRGLLSLVHGCSHSDVKHVAVSTNGSAPAAYYESLLDAGVNDFSVSLDGSCCAVGDVMSGTPGLWEGIVQNIRMLASKTYTTVGMVFTEQNVGDCAAAVEFADSLGVDDIRVIPSAQYNQALTLLGTLPRQLLLRHPILAYRVNNLNRGRKVRGLLPTDSNRCPLVLDDMVVAGDWHYPCIIYLREQGSPIGKLSSHMRQERQQWFEHHDTHADDICAHNCLDVCTDYNNKWRYYHG